MILDVDRPFFAFKPGAQEGWVLNAHVCRSTACTERHVFARRARRIDQQRIEESGPRYDLHLDSDTGALAASDDEGRAVLAGEPWLVDWVSGERPRFETRFVRLEGRRASPDGRADVAPEWEPGMTVPYAELFPFEGTPLLLAEGVPWAVVDAYCPDPACDCGAAHLRLVDHDRAEVEISGRLDARRPRERGVRERALWQAVRTSPVLLAELEQRQERVRAHGAFIVARHYEDVRAAVTGRSRALDRVGGYFGHASVTEATVARFFAAAGALAAARPWPEIGDIMFRLSLSGAISWSGSVALDDDSFGLLVWEEVAGSEPRELALLFLPRDGLPVTYRAQRIAGDWPLADGMFLPVLDALDSGQDEPRAPTAHELALTIVAAEVLTRSRIALSDALDSDNGYEDRVTVELGENVLGEGAPATAVTAVLTLEPLGEDASLDSEPSEADEAARRDNGEADDDDARDDVADAIGAHEREDAEDANHEEADEDDEDELDAHRELRAAAVDWALHRGAEPRDATLVDMVAAQLDIVARADGTLGAGWMPSTLSTFLRDHGPRKVMFDDDELDRVPRAMEWIVETLVATGHGDPDALGAEVEANGPVFVQRAREASRWGPAKSVFMEMRAAGVDVSDREAVDAFIEAKNRTTPASSRSPRARWVRGPADALPADGDLCPCGSGRRFKKCCKPR